MMGEVMVLGLIALTCVALYKWCPVYRRWADKQLEEDC